MADLVELGIGVNTSGVKTGTEDVKKLTAAQKEAAKAATELEKEMNAVTARGVAMGIIIADTVKLAGRLTLQFIDLGRSLGRYQDLAEQTNSDPAGLASMQVAADVAEVSLNSVALSMNRLTQSVSRAKDDTTGAGKALAYLHINAKEFVKLKSDEQYKLIAQNLKLYADAGSEVAVVQALLGRGGAQQLGMLKELASGQSEFNGITNEQIKRADDLNDAMTRQMSIFRQHMRVVSAGALGPMADLLSAFMKATEGIEGFNGATDKLDGEGIEHFADIAAGSLAIVATAAQYSFSWLGKFGISIAATAASISALKGGQGLAGVAAINDAALKDMEKFQFKTTVYDAYIKSREDRLKNDAAKRQTDRGTRNQGATGSPFTPIRISEGGGKSRGGKDLDYDAQVKDYEAAMKFVDGLKAQNEQLGMTTLQLALYKNEHTALSAEMKVTADQLAYHSNDLKETAEWSAKVAAATESMLTPTERLAAALAKIDALEAHGADSATVVRLRQKAYEDLDRAIGTVKDELTEMDQFSVQAARNIQDILGQGLDDAMHGHFDNILKNFGNMLISMAAQALAARVSLDLFGDYGKTGKVGGAFGSLLGLGVSAVSGGGFGTGAAFGNMDFGGFLAGGGTAEAGKEYVVGEHGPERLRMGATSGVVIPNGGGRTTITYAPQISIDARSDQAAIAEQTSAQLRANNKQFVDMLHARGVI